MTTYETETNGKDRLRVYVTGACEGLPELREALTVAAPGYTRP